FAFELEDSGHTTPCFHIDAEAWDTAVAGFYMQTLFSDVPATVELFDEAESQAEVPTLSARGYAALTGFPRTTEAVPANFAFSLVWCSLFRVLGAPTIAEGLLRLVHLGNDIELGAGWPAQPGETLLSRSRLVRLQDETRGRTVVVRSSLWRGDV